MSNPLFRELGGMQLPPPFNNFQKMMSEFQQFKANFQGDPQQEVQKLLRSGKMSQQQLDMLQGVASQLQQFMGM